MSKALSREENTIRWKHYLSVISEGSGIFSAEHVGHIKAVCDALSAYGDPTQAGPTTDGWMELVWDNGRHHLDIDVRPDGTCEWFYRDRETGDYAGEESRQIAALVTEIGAHWQPLPEPPGGE